MADTPKLYITARWCLDNGYWERVCELKGINVYAINEGLIDSSDEIELDMQTAGALGILERLITKPPIEG